MMGALLLDVLPKTLNILGEEVPFNWDFRTSIKVSEIFTSGEDDKDKIKQSAELYYGHMVNQFTELEAVEAIKKMMWFYTAGEQSSKSKKRQKQAYSFEQDGDYIYSAFRQQYNIDLLNSETLHWWQFRAMFANISSDTQFGKIVGYRITDLSRLSSKEERDFYRSMQKEYAINKKTNGEDDKLLEQINEALMKGEDISHLLKG